MARDLPADRLAGWLRDAKTPSYRVGLYASMLGHCGKEEHARLLRSLLDSSSQKAVMGLDGVLAGYTLLKPAEGAAYVRGLLKDPARELQRALRRPAPFGSSGTAGRT